ncbi:hypothetical protein CBS101457_006464 [Exobasidium rhododendri]|nr:hypothetical protein CBS101457_006464 [Exobasidium rhododendri]
MAGQARRGFAMSIVGESSSRSTGQTSDARARPLSRREAFGHDDDEEEDGEDGIGRLSGGRRNAQDEALKGFSKRGAEKVRKSPPRQGPRVIQKQADLNWMEERKRRLGLDKYRNELGSLTSMKMPDRAGVMQSTAASTEDTEMKTASERMGDEEQKIGLQKRKREMNREEEERGEILQLQAEAQGIHNVQNFDDGGDKTPKLSPAGVFRDEKDMSREEREDAAARTALLSGQGLGYTLRTNVDKVIPISEEEALKKDTDSRPEPPSLSDYAKMPVDEFGAALLRGMGWKEGMGAGKTRQGPTSAPEFKKRAALLGLGAKERKSDDNQSNIKGRIMKVERPERRYVPLLRKERDNGVDEQVGSSSPVSSRYRRERSRSPTRRREVDNGYERDNGRYRERSSRGAEDDDYERERERRKRREKDRGQYYEKDPPRERNRDRAREGDRDQDRRKGNDYRR